MAQQKQRKFIFHLTSMDAENMSFVALRDCCLRFRAIKPATIYLTSSNIWPSEGRITAMVYIKFIIDKGVELRCFDVLIQML